MNGRMQWEFAEECDRAQTIGEVERLFLRETEKRGFIYAACCSHVDPLKPPANAVMMVRYPAVWLAHFSERAYANLDPVFLKARRQALPFQWSDFRSDPALSAEQRQVLNEAGEAGLSDGITIPLHAPGALPASCSLVFGPDGVDPLDVRQAHWFAVYAHETARKLLSPPVSNLRRLSRRERQVLELVGRGKDDYAIGVILGIRQSTAHNTVTRAMAKYGVATRIQAVVRAMREGEIRIEDVAP